MNCLEFLEELSNKLYESKVLHDYKDGKIDYRKVHDFIVGLNEALDIPVVRDFKCKKCGSVDVKTEEDTYWCCNCQEAYYR